MKARHLDKQFDQGEDVSRYLDLARAKRVNQKPRRVTVDFPSWIFDALDKEANRFGVTRQFIIKVWISERLKEKSV